MPKKTPKKRILILAANPKTSVYLNLPSEVEKIKEALERAHMRDYFEIIDRSSVTYEKMSWTVLNEEPHIVHFCGHGFGNAGLLLESATNDGHLVSTKALSGLFELFTDKVECVLLNACYAEVQADVIKQHIKYVVGMSEAIGDEAAIKFAVGFYDAVCKGRDYEFAFKYACNRIDMAGIDQAHIPVLKKKSNGNDIVNLWVHGWAKQNYGNLPTVELDWTDYFDIDSDPRRIANQDTWDNVLKPSLIKARNELTQGRSALTVNIQGRLPLSAAFVIGSTFPDTRGYNLQVEQRSLSKNSTWWRSDASPSDAKFKVVKKEGEKGEHLVFGIGITGDGLRNMQKLYKSTDDLDKFDSFVYIEPENGASEQAISSDGDAIALVIHAKELIRTYRDDYDAEHVHLLLFAPLGFCLFLGQRLRAIGNVVTYEFIQGKNYYQPSVKLCI
jgi:SMODS-associated and fused to various effectors sensor domain/CHAT domain